jgi:hypothetical protein
VVNGFGDAEYVWMDGNLAHLQVRFMRKGSIKTSKNRGISTLFLCLKKSKKQLAVPTGQKRGWISDSLAAET